MRIAKKVRVAEPLAISVRQGGQALDFTYADFDMPVASSRATGILQGIASTCFQAIPATVDGYRGNYFVINVLQVQHCMGESRSKFLRWTEQDGRSDKIGAYRQISKLRIDSRLTDNHDVFRLGGWKIALIVSENVEQAFLKSNITGVTFMDVSA